MKSLLFVFYHILFSKYITESLIKSLFTGSSGSIVSQATERLSPLPENAIFRSNSAPFVSDVGTEELGHLEMIGAIVYQLTRNLSLEEIKKSGFDTYFVDHTTGIYPTAASGFPWSAASMQSKGDVITDLHENLAAEQVELTESAYEPKNIAGCLANGDTENAVRIYEELLEAKKTELVENGTDEDDAEEEAEAAMRSSLTSKLKPVYLELLERGNKTVLREFENILVREFGYRRSTVRKWE